MHIACRNGNIEMVKYLLDKGVDANKPDEFGYTAAYWAKENDHPELLPLLPAPKKIH